MKKINFTIDQNDLKALFIASRTVSKSFAEFTIESKKSYSEYYKRNSENLDIFGHPKTYSQWVNAQIIALT